MYRIVIILLTIVALSLSANSDKTKSNSQKIKKEVIDGYTLPPEPDPKINNATLLGVDVNHNGVRDDVERWIYKKYKEYIPCHQELDYNNTAIIDGEVVPSAVKVCAKHPIPYHPVVRAAVMEIARQAQIIIVDPKNARVTDINFTNAYGCASVIADMKDKNNRKISDVDLSGEDFDAIQFNTTQRARAYAKYNYYLSGGVYELPTDDEILKGCSNEVKALLKDLK